MKKSIFALCLAAIVTFVTAMALCIRVLIAPLPVSSFSDGGMRIVLDAGHGGIDGGVVGKNTGVKESDINLSITLQLKDVLTDMGFDVTLTRKTEAGLYGTPTKGFKRRDMQQRKEIIENTDPMLVVSIHQNYYPAQSSRGAQVFYNKDNEKSERLAKILQEDLNNLYKSDGAKGRKASAGQYFMLECTPRPSVIVECGFLSNAADEDMLTSNVGQKRLAETIAAGVMRYLSDVAA